MAVKTPKTRATIPTRKQRAAFAALLANGGNAGEAMKVAGYSDAMAKNPHKLMESDGFQLLLEKELPDDMLLEIHKQGLQASSKASLRLGSDKKGRPTFEIATLPDFNARHKYLATAYELKKRVGGNRNIVIATQVNVSEDRERFS